MWFLTDAVSPFQSQSAGQPSWALPTHCPPGWTYASSLKDSDVTEMAFLHASRMAQKSSSACPTCLLLKPLTLFLEGSQAALHSSHPVSDQVGAGQGVRAERSR